MVGIVYECFRLWRIADQAASTMLDVEDEVSLTIGAIADESTSGDCFRRELDGRDVDAVSAQAFDVQCTEIIAADAADDAARLTKLCNLIDEDCRCTRRKRADQIHNGSEAVASLFGHDFHQPLADRDDLFRLRHFMAPRFVPNRRRTLADDGLTRADTRHDLRQRPAPFRFNFAT